MNILFFSMVNVVSIKEKNIYTDLLRELVKQGHVLTIISPIEKRFDTSDQVVHGEGYTILKPHVGNVTNTPLIEKGKSIVQLPRIIIECLKENITTPIDLFITATPPVTIDVVIDFVKKKYNAKIYLLLKDIWPGNIFRMHLPGGKFTQLLVFSLLRPHEKNLYKKSDYIGCMSQACVEYILRENPDIDSGKVHINPNSITPEIYNELSSNEIKEIRNKYEIPLNKVCFIYGGTLGVGQGVKHVTECLDACKDMDCHFVVIGKGIQKGILDEYYQSRKQSNRPINVSVFEWIPKSDYDTLLKACDVGLIFIRKESIVPTFPSRILSYMEFGKPVLSCVSEATGVNEIIENGSFGWGCYSNDPREFRKCVEKALRADLKEYGKNSRAFLEENYLASRSAEIIQEIL